MGGFIRRSASCTGDCGRNGSASRTGKDVGLVGGMRRLGRLGLVGRVGQVRLVGRVRQVGVVKGNRFLGMRL
ncbi:hypothetical protein [Capnocytophaga leadbetteri]|uniref:hypothetical protein n=1 Tax=Capnocytophaga leadbetteri TaxID=327575 RepID=UPI0011B1FA6C|nr:hypothetical protein [Capnocytophaga leadbetteri]